MRRFPASVAVRCGGEKADRLLCRSPADRYGRIVHILRRRSDGSVGMDASINFVARHAHQRPTYIADNGSFVMLSGAHASYDIWFSDGTRATWDDAWDSASFIQRGRDLHAIGKHGGYVLRRKSTGPFLTPFDHIDCLFEKVLGFQLPAAVCESYSLRKNALMAPFSHSLLVEGTCQILGRGQRSGTLLLEFYNTRSGNRLGVSQVAGVRRAVSWGRLATPRARPVLKVDRESGFYIVASCDGGGLSRSVAVAAVSEKAVPVWKDVEVTDPDEHPDCHTNVVPGGGVFSVADSHEATRMTLVRKRA